ncbi:MAG: dephospho-CoA kinase [Planctomycetota bacterium]|nr:MAG: dephospho-CoA kinase [Planctomycetota bacterium]
MGEIASGKSTVARMMAEHGAVVANADEIGHRLLDDPAVKADIVDVFGEDVVDSRGHISRQALARQVFSDPSDRENLAKLEGILHPRILDKVREYAKTTRSGGHPILVIDAPLLLEAGWVTLCHRVIYVSSPDSFRRRWASERGWSEEELLRREAAQLPLELKRLRADLVVRNSGSLEDLRRQTVRLMALLVG